MPKSESKSHALQTNSYLFVGCFVAMQGSTIDHSIVPRPAFPLVVLPKTFRFGVVLVKGGGCGRGSSRVVPFAP